MHYVWCRYFLQFIDCLFIGVLCFKHNKSYFFLKLFFMLSVLVLCLDRSPPKCVNLTLYYFVTLVWSSLLMFKHTIHLEFVVQPVCVAGEAWCPLRTPEPAFSRHPPPEPGQLRGLLSQKASSPKTWAGKGLLSPDGVLAVSPPRLPPAHLNVWDHQATLGEGGWPRAGADGQIWFHSCLGSFTTGSKWLSLATPGKWGWRSCTWCTATAHSVSQQCFLSLTGQPQTQPLPPGSLSPASSGLSALLWAFEVVGVCVPVLASSGFTLSFVSIHIFRYQRSPQMHWKWLLGLLILPREFHGRLPEASKCLKLCVCICVYVYYIYIYNIFFPVDGKHKLAEGVQDLDITNKQLCYCIRCAYTVGCWTDFLRCKVFWLFSLVLLWLCISLNFVKISKYVLVQIHTSCLFPKGALPGHWACVVLELLSQSRSCSRNLALALVRISVSLHNCLCEVFLFYLLYGKIHIT